MYIHIGATLPVILLPSLFLSLLHALAFATGVQALYLFFVVL